MTRIIVYKYKNHQKFKNTKIKTTTTTGNNEKNGFVKPSRNFRRGTTKLNTKESKDKI